MADQGIAYSNTTPGAPPLSAEVLPSILARLDSPPSTVAIDTETVSLKDRTCIGLGVALSSTEAIYFRLLPDPSPHTHHFANIACNSDILKIYHNALFDLDVLATLADIWGWPPVDATNIADTSIMGRLQALDASLEMLAARVLGLTMITYREVVPARHTGLDVPWQDIARKCLLDCIGTYRLHEKLY